MKNKKGKFMTIQEEKYTQKKPKTTKIFNHLKGILKYNNIFL